MYYNVVGIELADTTTTTAVEINGMHVNLNGNLFRSAIKVNGTSTSEILVSDLSISSGRFVESGVKVTGVGSVGITNVEFLDIAQADEYIFGKC